MTAPLLDPLSLPREYRIALNCEHESAAARRAWEAHVLACYAAGPCVGCGLSVDVSGAPSVGLCGGCIEMGVGT